MNKIEKFGFYTAIVGLASDIIALTTFIGGLWGTSTTTVTAPYKDFPEVSTITTVREIPTLISSVLILVLVYGWLVISWVVTRRSFQLRKVVKESVFESIMHRSLIGIGIIILPIFATWLVITLQADVPTSAQAKNLQSRQATLVALTPTSVATVTPTTLPTELLSENDIRTATATSYTTKPNSNSVIIFDKTDATVLGIVISIPLQSALAFILYWVLYTLMPLVYPDMADLEEKPFF
jgi:hypothetical protein